MPPKPFPDAQRNTAPVKLRLPVDAAVRLRLLARRWGLTLSATVARLLKEHED